MKKVWAVVAMVGLELRYCGRGGPPLRCGGDAVSKWRGPHRGRGQDPEEATREQARGHYRRREREEGVSG